eukprot:g10923.t1
MGILTPAMGEISDLDAMGAIAARLEAEDMQLDSELTPMKGMAGDLPVGFDSRRRLSLGVNKDFPLAGFQERPKVTTEEDEDIEQVRIRVDDLRRRYIKKGVMAAACKQLRGEGIADPIKASNVATSLKAHEAALEKVQEQRKNDPRVIA